MDKILKETVYVRTYDALSIAVLLQWIKKTN